MSSAPQPQPREPWYRRTNWLYVSIVLMATQIALALFFGLRPQPVRIVSEEPPAVVGAMGWVEPTADERDVAHAQMRVAQNGLPPVFAQIARDALQAPDDDRSAFFWDAEQKVLGKILPAWNQGSVGSCVSFGNGRAVQDLELSQVAGGNAEQWPGHEIATEAIYGGSRVQIGGGRLRGDGSSGAWAAQWELQYGNLFRQKYDGVDLSTYSQSLCRQWGSQGVPAALIPECKKHPVKTAAMVQSSDEVWTAIGNGYPVAVCSNVGYEGKAPADGIMSPRGNWAHCMEFRGRFVHPSKGKCFVIQNSWGDYLGAVGVDTKDRGHVQLPQGCFAVVAASADRMVKQQDSYALSGFIGFPKQELQWFTLDKSQNKPVNQHCATVHIDGIMAPFLTGAIYAEDQRPGGQEVWPAHSAWGWNKSATYRARGNNEVLAMPLRVWPRAGG